MDKRFGHLVALAVGVATVGGSFWILDTTVALALAVGLTLGALTRLAVAYPDLLVRGHQPWPVARWAAVAGGFTVAVSMLVYSGGVPTSGSGERYAIALLTLGTTWAGVGFGVGLARADASTDHV